MNHREELRALVELAQSSNLGRAAELLGVSQSTLSECITRLERHYGAPLFERNRRGSRTTPYGQVIVSAAGRALRIMEEAYREIGLIKGSASGRLAIGVEPGLSDPFLTEAIARTLRRFPKLHYRVRTFDSTTLAHEVLEKHLDFYLGLSPDGPAGGLTLTEIGVVHAVPFVRRGHPLAGVGTL